MNFVERNFQAETALRDESQSLWDDVVCAITEAVEAYNGLYGKWHGEVSIISTLDPNSKTFALSREVPEGGIVTRHIAFDSKSKTIHAMGVNPPIKVSIVVKQSVNGQMRVLLSSDAADELSPDGASELLIAELLLGKGMSKTGA